MQRGEVTVKRPSSFLTNQQPTNILSFPRAHIAF
jgi:hypothetical protein